jgi:hypothetical protein
MHTTYYGLSFKTSISATTHRFLFGLNDVSDRTPQTPHCLTPNKAARTYGQPDRQLKSGPNHRSLIGREQYLQRRHASIRCKYMLDDAIDTLMKAAHLTWRG